MTTFQVHLLPAGNGDSILLEYGDGGPLHRVLIDGGTSPTWQTVRQVLRALPEGERRFELVVVSHVDSDHIAGVLGATRARSPKLEFDELWFNGYRHLTAAEDFGPVQGERLTSYLWKRADRWNRAFDGQAVVVPDAGALPVHRLPGGLELTLLSPTAASLAALIPKWERACRDAGLDPQEEPPPPVPPGVEPMGPIDVDALAAEPFEPDGAEANGSSIAFLAELDGRRVLFGADAHASVLEAAIARLPGGTVSVDAFKLPHHGSRYNTSPALLQRVRTHRYLFSSNGSGHHHPDRQTVARVLAGRVPGCELWFNYRSSCTSVWDDVDLTQDWGYRAVYPGNGAGGVLLEL